MPAKMRLSGCLGPVGTVSPQSIQTKALFSTGLRRDAVSAALSATEAAIPHRLDRVSSSVRSPRKLFIFIIYTNIFWIEVSHKKKIFEQGSTVSHPGICLQNYVF